MATDVTSQRRTFVTLLSLALLVPLSVAFLDRPVSSWSHGALHGITAIDWPIYIVSPILPTASLGLAAAGIATLAGWRPGYWGRALIACCIAVLVADTLKEELKFAFGRTWPETWINNNPSWIGDGTYAFAAFHGGRGWASFPSGHMTLITAPVSVLWCVLARLRWLWAGLVALVALGLLGSDYHFLGDVIAGTYLGAACGIGCAALLGVRPPPSAPWGKRHCKEGGTQWLSADVTSPEQ
ncbi:MAG: hypothetical protein QOD56_407 [Gammaproteobacteria bacterium]|jgi:membrane-associated phospholipid phosphatase|nr:hypothetical protein [Acetobacteraceae bacterium]MEA3149468.1 hypothetical protein [Gammaproteobacteria bacterium]